MVIGIDGKPGSGKSTVAKELTKDFENALHLEESNLLLKVVDMAIFLKNNNLSENEIVKKINDEKISYEIRDKEIIFKLQTNYESNISDLEKKLFAYENVNLRNKIAKHVYEIFNNTINDLMNKYVIVVSGRDLNKVLSKLDYYFFLEVNDNIRVNRQNKRDGEQEKIKVREELDKETFEIDNKAVIINATDQKIDDIVKNIKNKLHNYN